MLFFHWAIRDCKRVQFHFSKCYLYSWNPAIVHINNLTAIFCWSEQNDELCTALVEFKLYEPAVHTLCYRLFPSAIFAISLTEFAESSNATKVTKSSRGFFFMIARLFRVCLHRCHLATHTRRSCDSWAIDALPLDRAHSSDEVWDICIPSYLSNLKAPYIFRHYMLDIYYPEPYNNSNGPRMKCGLWYQCFMMSTYICEMLLDGWQHYQDTRMCRPLTRPLNSEHGTTEGNTMQPSNAYIRQLNMPSLVQIMACRLLGAKPISESMLVYCQLKT